MSKLLLYQQKKKDNTQALYSVTPKSAQWKYVGFEVYLLSSNTEIKQTNTENEICIVILSGRVNITSNMGNWNNIGERESVFEDISPYSLYLPYGSSITIEALTNVEVAICKAPGGGNYTPYLISPNEVSKEIRGEGTNTRFVRNILSEDRPAYSLLVVEVITPSGNWSSYPPHKHDTDNLPHESYLEETYYHRLNPPQGYALQRVYTEDGSLDETMVIKDRSVVLVPKGYHPVGTAYGYDLYYLNVMAGPKRTWKFYTQQEHRWLLT